MASQRLAVAVLLLAAASVGCKKEAPNAKGSSSGAAGTTTTGGSAAASSASGSSGAGATSGAGGTSAGSTGGGASSGSGGTSGCTAQQLDCGGTCVSPRTDPDHCGGCDFRCDADAGQACSAGVCTGSCQAPLVACDRACVDLLSDSLHCGSCANACPASQGCVDGACAPVLALDGGAGSCPAGGPPIFLGLDAGALDCAGNLAQVTFRWALCSCDDLALSAHLLTDGFDSARGPYDPDAGRLGGGVGTDGRVQTSQAADVYGTLWASGASGISTSADFTVGQELHAGGDCSFKSLAVQGDGYVAGDLHVQSASTLGGTLHQADGGAVTGPLTAGAVVHQPVAVPAPCDCTSLIPIPAIVAAHATSNDNARVGLSASALNPPPSDLRLDLPCGSYYLDGIQASHAITIVTHGNTALYVGGDVGVSDALAILPDPASQLDVFVDGRLSDSARLTLGSPNYPAQMRVYIQGASGTAVQLSATANLAANLYAAAGGFHTSSALLEYGAIFAGSYSSSAATTIHYDRAVVGAGAICSGADAGFPAPTPDAGPGADGGAQCASCNDCGNQACLNGRCTGCQTSADCCSPLVCNNGSCELPFR